jgi:hypothetical protein
MACDDQTGREGFATARLPYQPPPSQLVVDCARAADAARPP